MRDNIRLLSCGLAAVVVFATQFAEGLAGPDGTASQPTITLRQSPRAQADSRPGETVSALKSRLNYRDAESDTRASYREFSRSKIGQSSEPEVFTFDFHAMTKITEISATADFHVSGGSCIEGHVYAAGDVCNVEVTFTPQGPGHRTGRLSIAHSASVAPMLTPLGGTGYAPAISFTPSQINTVPGTSASGAGTLLSPGGLAVDGGDNLYIADTGNNLIKFRNSSGTITTLVGGGSTSAVGYAGFGANVKLTNPSAVAVDYSGTFYVADTGDNVVLVRYLDGILNNRLGDGATTSCPYSSPCNASSTKISAPFSLTTDSSGNLYVATKVGGSLPGYYLGEDEAEGSNSYYTLGTTAYNYYSTSSAIAVDAYSNLYYTYEDPGGPLLSPTPLCYILGQNRAYSINSAGNRFWTIAGSGPCGFSGDGGKATGAEISTTIGQFALDAAGNLYFADTGNNRVRRVDVASGIIHTVAGNGSTGSGGDTGPSTNAQVQAPLGVAVDSTGQVYTTAVAGNTTGTTPNVKTEIRTFGTVGDLDYGSVSVGIHTNPRTVLLSNVGNDTLNFLHAAFSSGNTTDYALDPNTTTCNFAGSLASGKSCSIGFIFSPSVAGARSALFSIQDDTVAVATAAKVITVSNTGTAALGVTSITLAGTDPGDYSLTKTCGTSLAVSATCTVSVTFKPTATGSRPGSVSMVFSTGTLTVSMTGTGTSAPAKVSLSPTPLAFGTQTVAKASSVKSFTLKNVGGSPLTISSYAFTGTNAADFSQTHTCVSSLAAGASCTISVVFKPAAAGARTATLAVGTSAGSATAAVSGTGAAAAVKPKVTLTSMANPLPGNHTLTLATTVADSSATKPTGVVKLMEGGTVLAEGRLADGAVTLSVARLPVGVHELQAVYAGDPQHVGASSATLRQMVVPASASAGEPVQKSRLVDHAY